MICFELPINVSSKQIIKKEMMEPNVLKLSQPLLSQSFVQQQIRISHILIPSSFSLLTSEQILVKIWCLKYQNLFKTLIISRFQGQYCHTHKTATLTPIQHTVPPGGKGGGPPPFLDSQTFLRPCSDGGAMKWL